jgi:ferric-chelate reductase
MSAPASISCLSPPGLVLGARVSGDWTRALNTYAIQEKDTTLNEKSSAVQVQVMLDGAYGGNSLDLGRYEHVLLIAGGSGATFAVGLLDDIIGRCARLRRRAGEVTKRIEFVWSVKSFGNSSIDIKNNWPGLFTEFIQVQSSGSLLN